MTIVGYGPTGAGKSILIRVDEGQYKNELAALSANVLIREAPFK